MPHLVNQQEELDAVARIQELRSEVTKIGVDVEVLRPISTPPIWSFILDGGSRTFWAEGMVEARAYTYGLLEGYEMEPHAT